MKYTWQSGRLMANPGHLCLHWPVAVSAASGLWAVSCLPSSSSSVSLSQRLASWPQLPTGSEAANFS